MWKIKLTLRINYIKNYFISDVGIFSLHIHIPINQFLVSAFQNFIFQS